MLNAFTVDLEDWYQGVGIPIQQWGEYEQRLSIGTERLFSLLDKKGIKATVFILGKVIEDHPKLVAQIIDAGHEIGCHTYSHKELFFSSAEELDQEITQCKELIKSYDVKYTGFRAPYFSVDERTLWALDVVKKHDFKYDSSIFPGDSKRTGIKNYERKIHQLENGITEVPISTFKFLTQDFAVGGAYFRILPYKTFIGRLKRLNASGEPGIFYIHPWELDPDHPHLSELSRRRKIPHYINLEKTERRLSRILSDFSFGTISDILNLEA